MTEPIRTVEELLAAYKDDTLAEKYVKLSRANLSGAYLSGAYLSDAYLSGAYLSRANLSDAYLSGAYLSDANVLDAIGIYSAFGLGMSSRQDKLYGGITLENGEIKLVLQAGCKRCSPDELREKVTETHGNNSHTQQYEAAITFIETLFAIDMADGRWDYLKTWEADHKVAEEQKP